MDKIIAPCGLDCAACEAYQATQANDKEALGKIAEQWSQQYRTEVTVQMVPCDGCTAESGRNGCYSKMCSVRACVSKRKIANCGVCREFGCDRITELHEVAPEARENIKAIRANRRK